MMRIWGAILAAILIGTAGQAAQLQPPDWEATAREVVQDLASGKFNAIEAQYDDAMLNALPRGKLAEAWSGIIAQAGAFQKITAVQSSEVQGYQRVSVTCEFEKAELIAQVVFESNGRLAGLRFLPGETATPWTPPAYADQAAFHEISMTVVNGNFKLPGTLTLPTGKGPFPGVVLVQGSGPHDEDETIGPNKPFKDLAWGLASHGIAALRYTKRTLKYGNASSSDPTLLTVEEETISDARAAVALMQKYPGVDSRRVYLLGHSLGAMLTPRIAVGDTQIAGIIVMAGNTRPLEQVIVDQLHYVAGLPSANVEQSKKMLTDFDAAAKTMDDPNLKPGTPIEVLGTKTYGAYWLDLRAYHPAETAAKLAIPMLILQGGRDYQVTKPDYEGWQKTLAGHSNATLKWYPSLNHLFMTGPQNGSGTTTPQEYDMPGHVSAETVNDIAAWVTSGGKSI
jgi:dienelactone hydrolase